MTLSEQYVQRLEMEREKIQRIIGYPMYSPIAERDWPQKNKKPDLMIQRMQSRNEFIRKQT